MHVMSSYTIRFDGTEAAVQKASAFVSDVFYGDDSFAGEKEIFVEDVDVDYVHVEEIEEFAIELAKAVPDVAFSIDGTVDASEGAGEYMDFLISYKDGKLTSRETEWYITFFGPNYETYEEFCEAYRDGQGKPRYSEEEYQQFLQGEWFVLNSGFGEIVAKVPLDDPIVIDLDATVIHIDTIEEEATALPSIPVYRCECGNVVVIDNSDQDVFYLFAGESLLVTCAKCGKKYRVYMD